MKLEVRGRKLEWTRLHILMVLTVTPDEFLIRYMAG